MFPNASIFSVKIRIMTSLVGKAGSGKVPQHNCKLHFLPSFGGFYCISGTD